MAALVSYRCLVVLVVYHGLYTTHAHICIKATFTPMAYAITKYTTSMARAPSDVQWSAEPHSQADEALVLLAKIWRALDWR